MSIYKPITNFPNYEIGADGTVWSLNYQNTNIRKLRKGVDNGNGYIAILLSRAGEYHMRYVHRLVAEHFLDNPSNKRTVNHKNGIRNDNRLENLEWATYSENHLHSYKKLGRINPKRLWTHCRRGHEFSLSNTYLSEGRFGVQRACKTCKLMRIKAKEIGGQI